ncbi:SH3 domain-containing protein [Bradyrhizobium sp. USDA 4473]
MGHEGVCPDFIRYPATSFADDTQIAEQLLESAIACPVPPVTVHEMDTPLTVLTRSTFKGNGISFRAIKNSRTLFNNDAVLRFAGDPAARRDARGKPRETNSQTIDQANYGDLLPPETKEDPEGRYLTMDCRSKQECVHSEVSRDFGAPDDRHSELTLDHVYFRFCDEATLQNAKAAFDALIATAEPIMKQLATRTVKPTVAGGFINLREGPGLDRDVIIQIPAGETIAVDEEGCKPGSDGRTTYPFCPITWNGRHGWASSSGFN